MARDAVVCNGIDATTGSYLLPPMSPQAVSQVARGQVIDPADLKELRWWHHRAAEAAFGPKEGIDPRSLAETGWGVIFAHDTDPAVREALGELLDHRRGQAASVREHHYREFVGDRAYRPGESKQQFLARQGAGPGPADPDNVPYYLLLIGGPEAIPYSFQYQLDVQYAVGRLHFDTVEEYARYARTVVAAETGDSVAARRADFFATRNPGDPATALSSSELVVPLAERLRDRRADWTVQTHLGEEATKERLTRLLGGRDTTARLDAALDRSRPGVTFTAETPIPGASAEAELAGWQRLTSGCRPSAWVETRIQDELAARSLLGLGGDVRTVCRPGLGPRGAGLHQEGVRLVVASRAAFLRVVAVVTRGAVAISVRLALPGGPVLALPVAWRFVQRVLAEVDRGRTRSP
jgi:hypothetical protein